MGGQNKREEEEEGQRFFFKFNKRGRELEFQTIR